MMDKTQSDALLLIATHKLQIATMALIENNKKDANMQTFVITDEPLTRAEKRRRKKGLKPPISFDSELKVGKYTYMEKPDRRGFISKVQMSSKNDGNKLKRR